MLIRRYFSDSEKKNNTETKSQKLSRVLVATNAGVAAGLLGNDFVNDKIVNSKSKKIQGRVNEKYGEYLQKILKTPGGWNEDKVNRRFRKLAEASSRLEGRVRNRASNVAGLSGNLLGLGVASAVNAGIKKHNKRSNRENEKDKAFSSKDERIDNAAIGSLAGASGLATADVIMSRKAKKDLENYQKAVKKIEEYRKASTNAAKKVAAEYNTKPADLQKTISKTNYQYDSYRKIFNPERTALKEKLKNIKTLRKFHKYSIPVAVGLSGAAVYRDKKNKNKNTETG